MASDSPFCTDFFQHSQQYYLSNNIITWKWKLLSSKRNNRAVFRVFLLSIWLYIWIITIFHDSFDNHPWIHQHYNSSSKIYGLSLLAKIIPPKRNVECDTFLGDGNKKTNDTSPLLFLLMMIEGTIGLSDDDETSKRSPFSLVSLDC